LHKPKKTFFPPWLWSTNTGHDTNTDNGSNFRKRMIECNHMCQCWCYIALWNSKCIIDGYNVLDVHSKTGKGETKQTVALERWHLTCTSFKLVHHTQK
jgi:hypothetical protein